MQAVAAPNSLRGPPGRRLQLQRHWDPKVESESDQRADKPRRRDADDRDLDLIERHTASDDGRVAPEAPLPETVADDGDRRGVPLVIGPQPAPKSSAHTEHVEVIARHHQAPDRLALDRKSVV